MATTTHTKTHVAGCPRLDGDDLCLCGLLAAVSDMLDAKLAPILEVIAEVEEAMPKLQAMAEGGIQGMMRSLLGNGNGGGEG